MSFDTFGTDAIHAGQKGAVFRGIGFLYEIWNPNYFLYKICAKFLYKILYEFFLRKLRTKLFFVK